MRILVTGARGFVGLNIVRTLASAGHTVLAVDRSPDDQWTTAFLREVEDRVIQVAANLSRPGALNAATADEPLDAVVHAAVITATTVEIEIGQARDIVDSNLGGTIEALDVAVARGAKRFVYISSPAAIGDVRSDGLMSEDVPVNPSTLYGITKLASELTVARWSALGLVDGVSVRIAQPYGPGERATSARARTSPIFEWLRDIELGEPLPTGPLDRSRDWTYVDDTARGIAELATAAKTQHGLYNLGTGRAVTVGDVIRELETAVGVVATDQHPAGDRLNPNIAGPGRPPLDPSRFEREFRWRPAVGIAEGMARYLEWWRGFPELER